MAAWLPAGPPPMITNCTGTVPGYCLLRAADRGQRAHSRHRSRECTHATAKSRLHSLSVQWFSAGASRPGARQLGIRMPPTDEPKRARRTPSHRGPGRLRCVAAADRRPRRRVHTGEPGRLPGQRGRARPRRRVTAGRRGRRTPPRHRHPSSSPRPRPTSVTSTGRSVTFGSPAAATCHLPGRPDRPRTRTPCSGRSPPHPASTGSSSTSRRSKPTGIGDRTFGVWFEGGQVEEALDVFKVAGGADRGHRPHARGDRQRRRPERVAHPGTSPTRCSAPSRSSGSTSRAGGSTSRRPRSPEPRRRSSSSTDASTSPAASPTATSPRRPLDVRPGHRHLDPAGARSPRPSTTSRRSPSAARSTTSAASTSGPDLYSSHVYIYDPLTNSFSEGAPMPRARGAGGVAVYGNRIYYAGGLRNTTPVKWFDAYDPVANTWTRLPDLPTAKDHFHAAVLGQRLYAISGRQYTAVSVLTENVAYDFPTKAVGDRAAPVADRPGRVRRRHPGPGDRPHRRRDPATQRRLPQRAGLQALDRHLAGPRAHGAHQARHRGGGVRQRRVRGRRRLLDRRQGPDRRPRGLLARQRHRSLPAGRTHRPRRPPRPPNHHDDRVDHHDRADHDHRSDHDHREHDHDGVHHHDRVDDDRRRCPITTTDVRRVGRTTYVLAGQRGT